jgi:hypothetical protein
MLNGCLLRGDDAPPTYSWVQANRRLECASNAIPMRPSTDRIVATATVVHLQHCHSSSSSGLPVVAWQAFKQLMHKTSVLQRWAATLLKARNEHRT